MENFQYTFFLVLKYSNEWLKYFYILHTTQVHQLLKANAFTVWQSVVSWLLWLMDRFQNTTVSPFYGKHSSYSYVPTLKALWLQGGLKPFYCYMQVLWKPILITFVSIPGTNGWAFVEFNALKQNDLFTMYYMGRGLFPIIILQSDR